jgi:uncharacterized surface protein with fasciclin (FAS1) repeats
MRKAFLVAILLFGAVAPGLAAPDGNPPGTGWTPDQNVLGYVEQSDKLTKLLALLKAADLSSKLRGKGPITLLAPTDDAFAGMPPKMLQSLQLPEHKAQLVQILGCHIIAGRIKIDGLKLASQSKRAIHLKSITGCKSTAVFDGEQLTINDENGIKAKLIFSDVGEANGIVQVIDGVLTPSIASIKSKGQK